MPKGLVRISGAATPPGLGLPFETFASLPFGPDSPTSPSHHSDSNLLVIVLILLLLAGTVILLLITSRRDVRREIERRWDVLVLRVRSLRRA